MENCMKKALVLATAVAVAATAVPASARDQIRAVGSSTVFPFTTAVAEQFGRTPGMETRGGNKDGRDHHPHGFTIWMAGGGVKPGFSYGESDDFAYNVARDPVDPHDLQATVMHLLGIDHERLTYKFQGRYFRLTDVHGEVVTPILA